MFAVLSAARKTMTRLALLMSILWIAACQPISLTDSGGGAVPGNGNRCGIGGLGIERPDDDPRTVLDRLDGSALRAACIAGRVIDTQINAHPVEIRDR